MSVPRLHSPLYGTLHVSLISDRSQIGRAGMARKKKGKRSKSAAGMKVPKALRRSGVVAAFIDSPLGREILAEALVAAAGAAAAALTRHRPTMQQVAHAGETVADAGVQAASGAKDLAQVAAGALAEVVIEAARNILPTSLTGATQGDDAQDSDAEAKPKKAGKIGQQDTTSRH